MIFQNLEFDLYEENDSSPTCFDLFSGAGGLSAGFLMAGGRPVGAVDLDPDSIATYRKNFPMASDVACCPIESWRPSTKPGEIDVIIGGPPCQGFSLARGLRFLDDPRNSLYRHFVTIVDSYQPKWMVMENVEGIMNIGGGAILKQILEDFARIGYRLECKVINMAQYGVPQLRKRAIFVGNNSGIDFEWPKIGFFDVRKKGGNSLELNDDLLPYNSVNCAISDMYLPQGKYFSHRANSKMRGPRNRNAYTDPAFTLRVRGDEFALCEHPAVSAFIPGPMPQGEIFFTEPKNVLQDLLRSRLPKWMPPPQIMRTKSNKLPTLKGTRRLTIREQARLQSFPDWISFEGRVTSQARQIGNAVPPLFAAQLFAQIFKHLRASC